jgi:CubicO group peptidase (beta-lactamase class C family)
MKSLVSVLLLIACLTAALPAATLPSTPSPSGAIDFAAIDGYITGQMQKHALPGVALAIVEGDAILYTKGYGTAGLSPMTPQTQMFIGSQTKSFTALAVAQLADAGKVDLDAPVQTYIPWFQVVDKEASRTITVNHLLHHTSGLAEAGFSVLLPDTASPEAGVRALAQAHQVAPVGTRHMYFNSGYGVLTYLVELVSGQSYAAYVQDHILTPLGMARTTAHPAQAKELAQGYTRLFGFPVPRSQPVRAHSLGAGYMVSTAEDMARYVLAMKNGGESPGGRLVSPAMARRIFSPGLDGYAMGWYVVDGGARIFHGGANETFRTDVNIYPRQDRAVVLLVNQGHLLDHYISAAQQFSGVEALVLGRTPLPVDQGWSVRWVGWGLGVLVLALTVLHVRNFIHLFTGWNRVFWNLPRQEQFLDVSLNFIIPTIILWIIFSQMQAFFGYRFNLLTNLAQFHYSLPDVFILMLVGAAADYTQGLIKVMKIIRRRFTPRRTASFTALEGGD